MDLVLNSIDDQTTVHLHPFRRMTEEEFWDFCQANPDLRAEMSSEGEIVVMPPAGLETQDRDSEIAAQLRGWAKLDGRGRGFNSNTAYLLPNGAGRSPDASWVAKDKIAALSSNDKRRFPHLCPDFVIELMSPSDRLKQAQAKMREWIGNGAALGWLIDPDHRTVHIYRPGRDPEIVVDAHSIAGEAPVDGFVLELDEIWAGL